MPPITPRIVGIDDLYLERVERARQQTFEEGFLAGGELFELGCEFMAAGIRMQFPEADAGRVRQIIAERLALGRRLENRP